MKNIIRYRPINKDGNFCGCVYLLLRDTETLEEDIITNDEAIKYYQQWVREGRQQLKDEAVFIYYNREKRCPIHPERQHTKEFKNKVFLESNINGTLKDKKQYLAEGKTKEWERIVEEHRKNNNVEILQAIEKDNG